MPAPEGNDRSSRAVSFLARDYAQGEHTGAHRHIRGQLLFALGATLSVWTDDRMWVLPSSDALWIPPLARHAVMARGRASMRTVYLHPRLCRPLGPRCRALAVSPLLQALILRIATLPDTAAGRASTGRLVAVLLDELRAAPERPLDVPLPASTRLRALCERLLADLSSQATFAQHAAAVGASTRTLARDFLAETGMGYTAWLRRARLADAVQRLQAGQSVTRVALDTGYDSPSAFTAMFVRAMGAAPRDWVRRRYDPTDESTAARPKRRHSTARTAREGRTRRT